MTVGERLRVVRKDKKLNQGEFGAEVGVSTATISLLEKGAVKITERNVRDICRAFNVNREWLLEGTGEMYAKAESKEELVLSFAEILEEYPGIYRMALLASEHMRVDDWKRLNELFQQMGV